MAELVKSPAKEVAVPQTREELKALLKRAHAGDEDSVPAVRKLLENPKYQGAFGGDLAEQVVVSFAKAMGGENLAFREDVLKKLELMRAELLSQGASPVERILVERVVACWLQVQDAELRYAQGQDDMTLRQGEFRQRRIDFAHRRFLSAVKALALVRKLAVPALQVNIARKQVNVVAPTTGG